MLKILFSLLLLINGGLIAYQQGYFAALSSSSREPSRLTQQLHPEQLKLVPLPRAQSSAASTSAAPSASSVALAAEKNMVRADQSSEVLACTEIGNFDVADARRFEAQVATLSLGERLTRRALPENVRHMVYMPPLSSREAADKKGAELRRLGIQDFFVIQDNSALQWGISLGVFKTEAAARQHLAVLNQKGVRSARVGAHHPAASRFVFQLRGLDAAAKESVSKIKQGFPRQELRGCSNPAAT